MNSRLSKLLAKLHADFSKNEYHLLAREPEMKAYAKLRYKAYSQNKSLPETLRKAHFLKLFAAEYPAYIYDNELIIGSQAFTRYNNQYLSEEQQEEVGHHGNSGHVIVDYARLIHDGIDKIQEQISAISSSSEVISNNKQAFAVSLEAFSTFIKKHGEAALKKSEEESDSNRKEELAKLAEICFNISHKPANSFHEALQFVWFIQVFLHAEANGVAISYGRFDRYLGDYLEKDLADGILTIEKAKELISCFWIKACEGDESQNLIVGGTDSQGHNTENILSLLCIQVAADLKVWQPSLSVRICSDSSEDFWQAILNLVDQGVGQPSIFNDPVITKSLERLSVPIERARDWGIVGCYEATPQGDTFGRTVNGNLNLPETFLSFLQNHASSNSFDGFYNQFLNFLANTFQEYCQNYDKLPPNDNQSPFQAICVTGCLESGLTIQEHGSRYGFLGINTLGLGTLIDSLYVIKKLVYEQNELSLSELKHHLENDFSDKKVLHMCRDLTGKFGSDQAESNELAQKVSSFIAKMILDSQLEHGVKPSPSFFKFGADINHSLPPTPDGRRNDDYVSYGAGPGTYCKKSNITTIMNSVSHVAHDYAANGSPIIISLNRNELKGENGLDKIRQLTEAYFQKGGALIQYNIVDAEQLKAAKADPEKHQDLTIRISGFSARFINISSRWQDALIERTEKGI